MTFRKLDLFPSSDEGDQWLRLALSKGPNRVGVFPPSPEGRNRSSFQNVVFQFFNPRRWTQSRTPVTLTLHFVCRGGTNVLLLLLKICKFTQLYWNCKFWFFLKQQTVSWVTNNPKTIGRINGINIILLNMNPVLLGWHDGNWYLGLHKLWSLDIKNGIFWDVTPRSSCKNRRFGGT
jgi:hypothetical protein